MIFDRELLEQLDRLSAAPWQGVVYRHMFADFSPERENTRGARWNPPETPAIYTSVERALALAEAEYQIGLQPVRPRVRRTVYKIAVTLGSVLDLTDRTALGRLGVGQAELESLDHTACQRIGGAVEWLGHDGLLVPSARGRGANLVIFPSQQTTKYEFRVIDSEALPPEISEA